MGDDRTQKNERKRSKVALFQQLVGTRNVLLPGPHDSTAAIIFISAVNQIFLLFHDAPAVLGSLKAFHEVVLDPNGSQDLKNQRLLELFKAMAKHLDINTEPLGEGFFMRAFSVNSLVGPQPLSMSVNGIRLQDGSPVLFGFQDLGGGNVYHCLFQSAFRTQSVRCYLNWQRLRESGTRHCEPQA